MSAQEEKKNKKKITLHTQRSQRVTIKAGDEANIGPVFSAPQKKNRHMNFCSVLCVCFHECCTHILDHPTPHVIRPSIHVYLQRRAFVGYP